MGEFLGIDMDWNDIVAAAKKAKLKVSDFMKMLPPEWQEQIKQAQRDLRGKRDEWIDAAATGIGEALLPEKYRGFWVYYFTYTLLPMLKIKLGEEWEKMIKDEVAK